MHESPTQASAALATPVPRQDAQTDATQQTAAPVAVGPVVNLHCHSSCSDGSWPPARLAEALADAGVQYAALADHDTTAGLADFAQVLAARGVGFVTAVEVAVTDDPAPVHLLGYGFDPENPELQAFLERRRRAAAAGYSTNAAEVIGAIHRAGGTVFLAHPLILGEHLEGQVAALKAAGLDGLEAWYEPYSEAQRLELMALAERYGLLTSAGTDFHGVDRPGLNRLGVVMPRTAWATFRAAHRLADVAPVAAAPVRVAPPKGAAGGLAVSEGAGLIRRRVLTPRRTHWRRFSLRIVLPTLLTLGLFLLTVFGFVLPAMRQSLLERKREMIRELTNSAWSILAESERAVRTGELSEPEAQQRALERIGALRYGQSQKDYFWVTDMQPRMLKHPYRPDLDNQDVSGFVDIRGRRLFVEFARVAQRDGEGYVEYYWQWNDNPDRITPKQSFVKRFQPWEWVIGTGIYLDDVQAEIAALTSRVTWYCTGISGVVVLLLTLVAWESLKLERRRNAAEAHLRESHEKYAALVAASTEGTLMVLDGRCAYANQTLCDLLGYSEAELSELGLRALIGPAQTPDPDGIAAVLDTLERGGAAPPAFEATLQGRDRGRQIPVVLHFTRIALAGKTGYIVVVRDLAPAVHGRLPASAENRLVTGDAACATPEDMQSMLLLMNEPLESVLAHAGARTGLVVCSVQTPIRQAARLLEEHRVSALAVTAGGNAGEAVIGIVTDRDMRSRVVAADAEGGPDAVDGSMPVARIMSAPVIAVPASASAHEALLTMQRHGIHHVAVRAEDGQVIAIVRDSDLLRLQQYSSSALIHQIQQADDVERLVELRGRFPALACALLDAGAPARHVTRLSSRLTDALAQRLVELAVAELGQPPARFCFFALGSEGRAEQTLCTDQDNALIYEDGGDRAGAEAYFAALGERLCQWLAHAGYAPCRGGIMASNARWRKTQAQWQAQFASWITGANPQDLLEFSIFFDLRAVAGDAALVGGLRTFVQRAGAEHPPFLLHLAHNALTFRPPVTLFGQLRSGAGAAPGTLSLKEAALPIVHVARLYALRHRLAETNTLDRLAKLHALGVLQKALHDDLADAYAFLLRLRLRRQCSLLAGGRVPDNLLEIEGLHHMEEATLKQACGVINDLRRKVSYDFLGVETPLA